MNKEKQIEEMAKELIDIQQNFNEYCAKPCRECELGGVVNCESHYKAEALYNAGYCKASDVARETFEEIEKVISSMKYNAKTPRKTVKVEELKEQVNWVLHKVIPDTIAELKKKYTESDIGRKLFLTREEAEKALERSEK